MSILRTSLAATTTPQATQEEQHGTAGAALVAGTLVRQHQQAGGGQDLQATLADAVSRLWQAIGQGDVCLPLFDADAKGFMDLKRSPIVMVDPDSPEGEPGSANIRPLVIANGRLFTYRYWFAEQVLAKNLIAMAAALLPELSADSEPKNEGSLGKAQRQALALATKRRLLILTGGPGTGKTHTLAAIVRAAVAAASQRASAAGSTGALSSPFAIAVAAPTGKATARMASAIESALENAMAAANKQAPVAQSNVLLEAMTLHRLLGLNASNASNAQDPSDAKLPFDLIVIDESSMVDTLMATRLLTSLRAETQLIFAGDRDQLASVQAGAFFGTLCTTSDEHIAACRITLDQNYRQKEAPEILAWSDAVRLGQVIAVPSGQQVLFDSGGPESLTRQAAQRFTPLVAAAKNTVEDDCVSLIRQYLQVQVLAMLRTGPEGVDELNKSIGLAIQDRQRDTKDGLATRDRWFAGRLIVVRKNASHRGLFNGDIGLVLSISQQGQAPSRCLVVSGDAG